LGSQNVIEFAPAVMALGTTAFAAELLAALNRGLVIDHLAIMRFEDRIRPPVIESAVWLGGEHVAAVQRAYLERFHRLDPARHYAGVGQRVGCELAFCSAKARNIHGSRSVVLGLRYWPCGISRHCPCTWSGLFAAC
jgi:hypothetical protein